MKNKVKIVILVAIIFAFSLVRPSFVSNPDIKASDQAEWSEEGSEGFHGFTVLEIVPYKGMAEIGYLIGGQEPVDKELMNYNNHSGWLSILGGAITTYRSYKERPLPASGNPDTGWVRARTYELQNGYFEYVPSGGADLYRMTSGQTVYARVEEGTGTHRAALPANVQVSFSYTQDALSSKNVNAYFIHEDDVTDTSLLFSTSRRYSPYSIAESPDRTGDYDYDPDSRRFILNKGNGKYNVIFSTYSSGDIYYMLDDYDIVPEGTGVYSYEGALSYIAETGGDFRRYTNAPVFTYEQWWGGNYRWVQDDAALTRNNFQVEGNRIWIHGNKAVKGYQYTFGLDWVNNEWFKLRSLGVPSEMANNYPVRVITITPNELNNPDNHHYIDEANLIYINADNHNNGYLMLYENCSYEGLSLPANQKYGEYNKDVMNFAVNDTNWEVTIKLFKKIAGIGCAKAAAILDVRYYLNAVQGSDAYRNYQRSGINFDVNISGQTGGTSVNLAKLYIMIVQRNMVDFYNSFMNPDKPNSRLITEQSGVNTPTGTTGSFVRPNSTYSPTSNNALYWNGNTFLPWGLNENGEMTYFGSDVNTLKDVGIFNANITQHTTDLANNVLIMNGQEIFGANFIQPVGLPDDVQEEAEDHLGSLDPEGTGSLVINIGNLVNVITNNGSGYENVGGISYPEGGDVEGPEDVSGDIPDDPGGVDDESGGSNLRSYKRVLNIQPTADFAEGEAEINTILSNYNVQIINMTSSQFNGSMEDINSLYDMIYMGSGYGRFFVNTGNNRTDFNDNSLDGFIYFAEGDYLRWGSPSNLTQSRYTGNDITQDKRIQLEAFLDAGFPIVVDSVLYELNNANARVKNDTVIYDFISDNKSRNNLLNMEDYIIRNSNNNADKDAQVVFKNRLRNGLSITRPAIQLLEPSSEQDIYVDPVSDILTIRFKLLPKNGIPSYYKYNAYLYVDRNADGIFDEADRLNVISSDDSSWENVNESNDRIFSYQYSISALNGVYKWKLLIERADNNNIRGSIVGYCANTNKEDIYILHIRENTSPYDMDVLINDTSKLINNFAGPGVLRDYNLHFTSLTLQEYESAFESVPYNPAEWEATGKLSPYHLLILDNPDTPVSPANGAAANIKDEIARGLAVVFTRNALGYANQDEYFSSSGYSFIDHPDQANAYRYTYGFLSDNADLSINTSQGQKFIYRDMAGENGITDLYSDEAYITTYMTRLNDGYITKYPYPLDSSISIAGGKYSNEAIYLFDDAQSKRLIVWYCLSDSRSPVVRYKYNLGGSDNDLYKGVYSSSPNDPQNNYYLFSNGRCFYSGISLSSADRAGNDDEMKLFVNTLIAAYGVTRRNISRPPVVEITSPSDPSVTISRNDLTNGDYVVKFRIGESSTNVDLEVSFGGEAEPAGNWDDIVYEAYVNGTFGDPIAINNTHKVIEINKTYAIRIPEGILAGSNELVIMARNEAGNVGFDSVTISFASPPVVAITDPVPSVNGDKQYIYLNIDFSADINDNEYLANAPKKRIRFTVSDAVTENVYLGFESEGLDLAGEGIEVYYISGSGQVPVDISVPNPQGSYELRIPMLLMANRNLREFIISASDTLGNSPGSTTFILLRRGMFPLD